MVVHFSENDVRAVLRYRELIPAMERALASYSSGEVQQPLRTVLPIEDGKRYLGVMPAAARDAMGVKVVAFYPVNEGTAVPTHTAMVLLFAAETGEPLATFEGRTITEMRTAAVSAAVTNRLAAPQSRVLALLGSGVQALAHLEALRCVRDFEEVRVWSRDSVHAQRFAAAHGATACDAESAVRGADVIVTATSSLTPVLRGTWLNAGAHVNAVGATRPTWRELDDDAMSHTLVVDSREAALAESGDVILSGASIYAEAGELFAGTKPCPVNETTIFKSLGLAVEDVATARLIYGAATNER